MKKEPLLSLNQAKFGYNSPLVATDYAEILPGTITLLLGENGTGKTTTFRSLLGQIPLLGGEVKLLNQSLSNLTTKNISLAVAVAFSKTAAPAGLQTFDFVALGRFVHSPYFINLSQEDKFLVEEILERFDLQNFRNTSVDKLSDGNLQKAQIAMTATQQTPLLFLDEPTTHLDNRNKHLILRTLRELADRDEKGILISTHDWQHALPFADQVWLIHEGKLKTGFPTDIIHQHSSIFFGNNDGFLNNIKIQAPTIELQLLQTLLVTFPEENLRTLHSFSYKSEKWEIETKSGTFYAASFAEIKERLG